MYARCPECHTTLVVRAAELALAGGVVCCGDCRKVFNALVNLFDVPPAPGSAPAGGDEEEQGMPPVLQPLLVLSEPDTDDPENNDPGNDQAGSAQSVTASVATAIAAPASSVTAPATVNSAIGAEQAPPAISRSGAGPAPSAESVTSAAGQTAPHHSELHQAELGMAQLSGVRRSAQLPLPLWIGVTLVLVGFLAYQGWQIWGYHRAVQAIEALAAQEREPEAFRIINRDVHTHPSVQNAQMASLRMRNTAPHPQPYPVLEVHLLDTTQNVVAVRRFHADEYLPPGGDPQQLVKPGQDFALVLQLRTPVGGNGGMTFHVR